MVLNPQKAKRHFIQNIVGIWANKIPPSAVVSREVIIIDLAEKWSASAPPGKYESIAMIPYKEKAVPSSRLVISKLSKRAGLKILATMKGRLKIASPEKTRANMVKKRLAFEFKITPMISFA
jgi:hypothetical protein